MNKIHFLTIPLKMRKMVGQTNKRHISIFFKAPLFLLFQAKIIKIVGENNLENGKWLYISLYKKDNTQIKKLNNAKYIYFGDLIKEIKEKSFSKDKIEEKNISMFLKHLASH